MALLLGKHIDMKDGRPFTFAGLWENWKDPESGEWLLQAVANGSAVSWQHINLLGEYDFSDEKLQDTVGIRPPKIDGPKGHIVGSCKRSKTPRPERPQINSYLAFGTFVGI